MALFIIKVKLAQFTKKRATVVHSDLLPGMLAIDMPNE